MIEKIMQVDESLPIFLPVSPLMILWYFVFISLLLADYFVAIYFICFHSKDPELSKTSLIPVLLIVLSFDLIISLNTSFIKNGRIITDKKISRLNYLKSFNFFLDFVSFVVVAYQAFDQNYHPVLSLIVFIKYNKVKDFDLLIRKYVIRSQNFLLFYHLLKHMILLVMVCHSMGSFFFYLDVKLIELQWYPIQMLWVYSSYSYNNIIDMEPHWQYCYSFYYAVVTLSGVAYGDLTPLNPTQALYTFLCLVFPLIIYAYIFSVISAAIKERQIKKMEIKQYRKIARNYLIQSGISQQSISRFVNYLSYAYENKTNIDNNFLDQVAPSIKSKYMHAAVKDAFKFDIFERLVVDKVKLSDIEQIVSNISSEEVYPAKQTISTYKIKKPKLYFIVSGQASEYIYRKQKKYSKFIEKNNFFNQYCFFTGLSHFGSNHMFQTTIFTICQAISLPLFLQRAQKYTGIFQSYHNLRNQLIFNRRVSYIRMLCFFCEQKNHIIDNCSKLRIQIDPIQCSSKENIRKRRFFRRDISSNKKYGHLRPIKLFSEFFSNLKVKETLQSKGIQTQKSYFEQKPCLLNSKNIDRVKNWKIFQPQYTFGQIYEL